MSQPPEPGMRISVLLLTYGEPPSAGFAEQYSYSLEILKRLTRKVAPIPRVLLPLLALRRAFIRTKTWKRESYASPLESITTQQAQMLEQALTRTHTENQYKVTPVWEFRPPFLNGVLCDLESLLPERIILLPMYVADSDFTTNISKPLVEARTQAGVQPSPEYAGGFCKDDELADLMGQFVMEQIAEKGWGGYLAESALVLGSHGTLVDGPATMNTGLSDMLSLYEAIQNRLSSRFAHVTPGWLNHTAGGTWITPDLGQAMRDITQKGLRRMVYFPFGFLADNAETELESRRIYKKHKGLDVLHLPCMNTHPSLIDYLARNIDNLHAGS